MRRGLAIGAVMWAAMAMVGETTAQTRMTRDPNVSVLGTVGQGKVWDDEGHIGTGLEAGVGLARLVSAPLAIELLASRQQHARETSFLSWDGTAWSLIGRLIYRFGGGAARVRPFVAAGAGMMRSTGTVTERESLPVGPAGDSVRDRRDWAQTGSAWEVAGGVEFGPGRVFIRPELAFTAGMLDRGDRFGIPEPPYQIVRARISAGVRF